MKTSPYTNKTGQCSQSSLVSTLSHYEPLASAAAAAAEARQRQTEHTHAHWSYDERGWSKLNQLVCRPDGRTDGQTAVTTRTDRRRHKDGTATETWGLGTGRDGEDATVEARTSTHSSQKTCRPYQLIIFYRPPSMTNWQPDSKHITTLHRVGSHNMGSWLFLFIGWRQNIQLNGCTIRLKYYKNSTLCHMTERYWTSGQNMLHHHHHHHHQSDEINVV